MRPTSPHKPTKVARVAQHTVNSCGDQFMPRPALCLDQVCEGFASLNLYIRMIVINWIIPGTPSARGETKQWFKVNESHELVTGTSLDAWQHIYMAPNIEFWLPTMLDRVWNATGISPVLQLLWVC